MSIEFLHLFDFAALAISGAGPVRSLGRSRARAASNPSAPSAPVAPVAQVAQAARVVPVARAARVAASAEVADQSASRPVESC